MNSKEYSEQDNGSTVYGEPGEEWGDRFTYQVIRSLPEECTVYAQCEICWQNKARTPDYIIVSPEWGIIILEVKDWKEILEADGTTALIRLSDRREIRLKSPVEQAKEAAFLLADKLSADRRLLHDAGKYKGLLRVPYAFAGVLPNLSSFSEAVKTLKTLWGESRVFGYDDLETEKFIHKIENILLFRPRPRLCSEEMEIIGSHIAPSLPVNPKKAAEPDNIQIKLITFLHKKIFESPHIRLVRGFAGTGKTDILLMRVNYLKKLYPDMEVLVTTFNNPLYEHRLKPELGALDSVDVITFYRLCFDFLRKQGDRPMNPVVTQGLIANIIRSSEKNSSFRSLAEKFGTLFIAEEIIWIKETVRAEREKYVDKVRTGRGGPDGRKLDKETKEVLFDLFEVYQQKLKRLKACDWADIPNNVWKYLQKGIRPERLYDAVFIDEAQHFAPIWVGIVKAFLKPEGMLFVCDDPSQSLYRQYSWRQKGIDMRGHTCWLKIPYRNTLQIFEAAYTLIKDNPAAQTLRECGERNIQPNLDARFMRTGDRPEVHCFPSPEVEYEFVAEKIEFFIRDKNVSPYDIAVLHEDKDILRKYASLIPEGVRVFDIRRQTGLEYQVVFIPQVQTLDNKQNESDPNERDKIKLKFYTTMTRAREKLFMSYQGKCPKVLEELRAYVDWIGHT